MFISYNFKTLNTILNKLPHLVNSISRGIIGIIVTIFLVILALVAIYYNWNLICECVVWSLGIMLIAYLIYGWVK